MNVIANTFGDNACVANPNSTFNFNPIQELIKLHEENWFVKDVEGEG